MLNGMNTCLESHPSSIRFGEKTKALNLFYWRILFLILCISCCIWSKVHQGLLILLSFPPGVTFTVGGKRKGDFSLPCMTKKEL